MKVSKLFQKLSFGELSNLAIGNDGAGTIRDTDKPKIISFANEALDRIYTRFPLKEDHLAVLLSTGRYSYNLDPVHNASDVDAGNTEPRYILDTPADPYIGDLIKVLDVRDSYGRDRPVNEAGVALSVFTPEHNILQVPYLDNGAILSINYQAKHPELVADNEDQLVELPTFMHHALTAYIGHRVYSSMVSQEAGIKSTELLARYEMICVEVEEKDLLSTSRVAAPGKFEERGWA